MQNYAELHTHDPCCRQSEHWSCARGGTHLVPECSASSAGRASTRPATSCMRHAFPKRWGLNEIEWDQVRATPLSMGTIGIFQLNRPTMMRQAQDRWISAYRDNPRAGSGRSAACRIAAGRPRDPCAAGRAAGRAAGMEDTLRTSRRRRTSHRRCSRHRQSTQLRKRSGYCCRKARPTAMR